MEGNQLPGPAQQPLAIRGEGDSSSRSDEQLNAEFPFKPGNIATQRLLGDVQPGRRTAEMELIGYCHEVAQEARVDVAGHVPILTTQAGESLPSRCWTRAEPAADR